MFHRGDLRLGASGASGSVHYPGRSTYGGDCLPGAFGSGGVIGLMEGMSSLEPLQ